MPELPEVETVRRGLAPVMEGVVIARVDLRRPDLRFPLPEDFAERLAGAQVEVLDRRGKYLVARLSTGESLIAHLGMSGRFIVAAAGEVSPGGFATKQPCESRHDHIVFDMAGRQGARIIFNDPRRFGFMDLVATARLQDCRHFKGMGPEPLGNAFSAAYLDKALKGKQTSVKDALMDQRVVAGLGNIYVCEALFRAGVSPRRRGLSIPGARSQRLCDAIIGVLRDAIEAGGSSLRDFAAADGALGYFQHRFSVYGREGAPCARCRTPIKRIVQGARSTFFCPACQR